jgi:hypothetical protein
MVNLHEGNISLVIEGKMQPPAFGKDALCFPKIEQDRQRYHSKLLISET